MPRNIAAWLESKQAPLVVKPAPYTHPRDLEIVVKNHALAINPIDWILQTTGNSVFRWIKFPFVLGVDVAGEVVEVGSGVSRFKVGDRVIGHAVGTDKDSNNSAEDGFQLYTVLLATMTTIIPPTLSYENGVVLPLGVSTAACGLFQKDQLALEYPALKPHPNGETVLIWGGSSSVGSNAIQLAVGYHYLLTN
jgi:NADPH:quinone reductase-like Zn-dependent oxidoreductase